jgi:hypothetical protein
MHLGVTPYLRNAEHADGKTFAAKAATDGIAKDEEIIQIFELQTRGTKIPRSACVAIDSHRGF